MVIGVVESLKLPIERLDVNGPKPTITTTPKLRHEVAAYEASRSRHKREIVWVQLTRLRAQVLLSPSL